MSRLSLQVTVIILALVPIAAGFAGIVGGPSVFGKGLPIAVALDSQFRYLSGLLAGIGFAFWTTVPRIETKGVRFRLLTAIVVLGGLGRLLALVETGSVDGGTTFALGMELGVTPALAIWQRWVARDAGE